MDALLEPIVASPKLSLYVSQLEQILEEERKRREQFYNDITPEMKVEFINGEIIVQSPARLEHIDVGALLMNLLINYNLRHRIGYVRPEKLLITLTRNDYEPDISFFTAEKAATFIPGQWKFPAPDFIVEILSASTERMDRGIKMTDYAAHGVREYWLIDTDRQCVERYHLDGDTYTLLETVTTGMLRSDVITGFAVPIEALFDEPANLNAVVQILTA
jgi:Uma2 family endonuclease